jgi:peptidyl-prolyl cis-trans isomerase D
MFEFIRRHQKFLLIFLIALIVPSFVVVGAWDLIAPGGGANTVAKVGGQTVQYAQWERAHQQAVRQVQEQFGGRIDPSLIDTDAARRSTLEDLITQQVLFASAREFGIRATDQQLQRTIAAIPAVQRDGKFSLEAYQQALRAQGLTPEGFEAQVRAELAMEVVPGWLASSSIAPRSVARRLAQLSQESRVVRVKRFAITDYLAQATVTDQDAKEFYDANTARFQTPEEVDIQLIAFTKPATADQVEQFANIVYEQSDTLEPASKALGLPIQTIKQVRKTGPTQAGSSAVNLILANPKLLDAIFSIDAIQNKRNTESVEIAPGILASARVIAHRPAAPIAFEAVKSQLVQQLRNQKAAEKALQAAQTAAQSAGQGQAVAGLSAARLMSRGQLQKHASESSVELVNAVFSASIGSLPAAVSVSSPDGSAWLGVIEAAEVPSADSPAVREAVGREFARLEQAGMQDTLDRWIALQREKIGVKVYADKIAKSGER